MQEKIKEIDDLEIVPCPRCAIVSTGHKQAAGCAVCHDGTVVVRRTKFYELRLKVDGKFQHTRRT